MDIFFNSFSKWWKGDFLKLNFECQYKSVPVSPAFVCHVVDDLSGHVFFAVISPSPYWLSYSVYLVLNQEIS